jgi:iron-sulfur cluster assembly protein
MTKLDLDEVFDEAKDEMFETDGIKVAVDKRSIIYIQGATVDFHDSIDKRGFVVSNPNAVSRCGCNQSFSM